MSVPDLELMKVALNEAYSGIKHGHGGPFGVVISRRGKVLYSAHNTVLKDNDPTRHAEINAISGACAEKGTYDLTGCEMYSTTEPCPMCFSAIHWARISKVWWGTGIEDVMRLGFNELPLNNADIINITASEVLIEGGVCIDECRKLLEYWDSLPDKKVY